MSGVHALKLIHIYLDGNGCGFQGLQCSGRPPPPHLRASWHRRGCPAAWDLGLPTGSGEPQLMNIHEVCVGGGLAPTDNSCASISPCLLCLLSVGKGISASVCPFLQDSGLGNPEDNHRAVSACQQMSQQLVGMAKGLSKCCDGL